MDTKTWKEFASKKAAEIKKVVSDSGETNLNKILGIDENFEGKLFEKIAKHGSEIKDWSGVFAFGFGEFDSPEETMMAIFQLTVNAKED